MPVTIKKQTKEDKQKCALITCEARLSYPHVFAPHAPKEGDKKKYSVTLLLDKTKDNTGLDLDGNPRTLQRAFKNAKIAAFGPKENWPKGIISPIQDGDDPKFANKKGYKGHWVVTAKANADQKPAVVDANMIAITEPNDLYPGCYVRAYVQAYVNEFMGTLRVLLSLEHVQKLREGEPFGGKKPIDQVFSPVVSKDEEEDEQADF